MNPQRAHPAKRGPRARASAVPWTETACLVRFPRTQSGCLSRTIVLEGTFADVAQVFGSIRMDEWDEHTIFFTERRVPPFSYERADFFRHVLRRLLKPQ